MKINKNDIKMQEESMIKYLEEMVVNSVGWISWNLLLKIRAQIGKVTNDLYFLLFIENFQIFENFHPLSYSFDIF